MSEGERPEQGAIKGSWNQFEKSQRREQAQEQAELRQQYRKTKIDSHIAQLRQKVNTPLYDLDAAGSVVDGDKQERANVKYKLRYEQQAGVYSYMKDTFKAKTIGDVEEKLQQKAVDTGVVRLWVEGRMIEHDDLLEKAIVEGYPELDTDIQQMRGQQSWRKADNVSDFLAGVDADGEDLR